MGSARVVAPSRVFRLPASRLGPHGEAWFPFAVHLLRGLIGTARRIEHNARQREALVALGTLAAGLAHEINNPASAAVRSVGALQESSDDLLDSLHRLAGEGITADQFVALDGLRRSIDAATAPTGVALAEREDELSDLDGGPRDRPRLGDRAGAGRRGRRRRLVRAGGRRAGGSGPPGRPGVGGQRGDHGVADRRGPGRDPAHLRPRLRREVLLPARPRDRPGGEGHRRARRAPGDARPQAARGRHRAPRLRRRPAPRRRLPRRAQPGVDQPHRQRRRRHGGRRDTDGEDVRRRARRRRRDRATPGRA